MRHLRFKNGVILGVVFWATFLFGQGCDSPVWYSPITPCSSVDEYSCWLVCLGLARSRCKQSSSIQLRFLCILSNCDQWINLSMITLQAGTHSGFYVPRWSSESKRTLTLRQHLLEFYVVWVPLWRFSVERAMSFWYFYHDNSLARYLVIEIRVWHLDGKRQTVVRSVIRVHLQLSRYRRRDSLPLILKWLTNPQRT